MYASIHQRDGVPLVAKGNYGGITGKPEHCWVEISNGDDHVTIHFNSPEEFKGFCVTVSSAWFMTVAKLEYAKQCMDTRAGCQS